MTVSTQESRPRPFSWVKKTFIGLFALIFFLLAAVFATYVVLQNNPSRLEVVLETVVTRLLGRELQIGKLLESELGLESYLLARDVTLANPAWAKDADLVRAGRVLVRVNLPSIWQDGPILIRQLELKDVSVNLLAAQDNPANWDFWPDAQQAHKPDDGQNSSRPPKPVFPLQILNGSVARGALTFHSSNKDVAVTIADLTLSEPREGGLINLDLDGVINDIPLKVKGRLGPVEALLSQRNLRTELSIQMGELSLESKGSIENYRTFSGPDLQVEISSPRSQPFLSLLGITGSTDGPFDFKGRVTDAHPGIAIDTAGQLNGVEVKLSGEVKDPLAFTGVQIKLDLHGPSISELGTMLGVSGLPGTAYDIKGTVESKPKGVQSLNFQFKGPTTRLVLSGDLGASPDYQGSHLKLELSGEKQAAIGPWLGLDFLPATPFQLNGALTRVDSGWQLSETVFASDELQLKFDASVDQLPQPTSLTAHLELSSSNISSLLASHGVEAEGVPALPIELKAEISGSPKALKIDQMTAHSGASRLKVSGLLGDLTERKNIDLAVELKTANLMKLLPLKAKANAPPLSLDVRSQVVVSANGLGVEELKGTMEGASIALQGNLNLVPPVKNSKFSVQFKGPNLGAVLNPWLEQELPEAPFQLAMKADFSSVGVAISQLEATVDKAKLNGQITIADLKNPASSRGSFKLVGPSSWKLINLLGYETLSPDSNYSISVGVNSSGDWLRLNPIVLHWGKSDLSGSVNYRPGSVPTIEADLHSKFVDTPFLFPGIDPLEEETTEAVQATAKNKNSTTGELTKKELADRIIPDVPLDFSPLKRLQGSFKYRADKIYVNQESFSSMSLDIALKDGLLSSRKIHWDGTVVNGDAALSLRALEKGGEIDVILKASRLPVFILLGGEEKYDPNAMYKGHLQMSGDSWREMAKSANGAWVFHAGGGKVDNNGGGLILGDVFDQVVGQLNPFQETDRYTRVVCHAGAFTIVDGKASLVPGAVMRTEKLDLAVGGIIDLHTEGIDLVFSTRSRKGIGISAGKAITPYLKLGGTLAYPGITIDPAGVALSGGAAVATMGMSILAEGLWDRWIATAKNPCDKLIEQQPEQDKEYFRKLLSPISTDETIK